MRVKVFVGLIAISLSTGFLSGCSTATVKPRPDSSTRSSFEGKGFSVNVVETNFFSASPWMLVAGGRIAADATGKSDQQQFGLVDPGRKWSEMVRLDLSKTYHIKEGNDFLIKFSSGAWNVHICAFDNCRTSRRFQYIGKFELIRVSDGEVIVSRGCHYRDHVEPDTLWNDDAVAIKEQGRIAADFCRKEIIDWISNDN
jgi:hypothetical protein